MVHLAYRKWTPGWGVHFYNATLVQLSGHDSNKYQAALRFKKQISKAPGETIQKRDFIATRGIDGFGEVVVKAINKPQVRLSSEEITTLISEYQAGKTVVELSEKYGCHRVTVTKILARNGVEIRPHGFSRTKQDDVAIIAGYQAGKSTYDLAGEYGCDHATISKILKEYNVEVSNRRAQKKLNAEKVISMYAEMHTTAEIAKKFSVSPKAVLKCLREHGVKIRSRWDYT